MDADDGVLAVRLRTREGANGAAVRRLDAIGAPIADVNLRRPTLDDVLLTLTGRAAEEDGRRDAEPTEEVAA